MRCWRLNLGLGLTLALVGCAGRPGDSERDRGDRKSAREPASASMSAIDAELERRWAELGVVPSPLASDAEFLRRVSLDLIGRVPTQVEVEAFLAADGPDKRARVVDELLARDEFAQHWAGFWADQLLPNQPRSQRLAGVALETHLAEAIGEGRSWASVVERLLTAEGTLGRDQTGPLELAFLAGRAVRKLPREELAADLASTSARVFLGARIECAQCHDHPYDSSFTREDFWAQAALFGRTSISLDRSGKGPPSVEIGTRQRGELRVALDEAGEDKRAIAPRYMGADELAPTDDRRATLASSIIADPRFAEATVGQVWTRLLGRGIIEPWDDLLGRADRPALLLLLAAQFRADNHDLRALIREIVLSQAYQRSSAGPQTEAPAIAKAEAAFARAAVRPLSAEQLFGSLLTVTELEQVEGRGFRRVVEQRREAALKEYAFVFSDDEMGGADEFSGNVPQALLLLNGALTNHGVVAREGSSLDRILAASEATDERLEDLWLTLYGRRPSASELELGRAAVGDGERVEAWEDLMFAILYSTEFASNH